MTEKKSIQTIENPQPSVCFLLYRILCPLQETLCFYRKSVSAGRLSPYVSKHRFNTRSMPSQLASFRLFRIRIPSIRTSRQPTRCVVQKALPVRVTSLMGYACAMAWVMLVVMSVITLVIFKTSKKWVFSEADA